MLDNVESYKVDNMTDQNQKVFAIRNRFGHYWGITSSDGSGQMLGWTNVLAMAQTGKTAKSRTKRIEQLVAISKLTGHELWYATCKFNIVYDEKYQLYKSSGYEDYSNP